LLTTVTYLEDRIGTLLLDLLKPVGVVLIIITTGVIIWRLGGLLVVRRRPQLIIDPITNASGEAQLDKLAPGLSEQLREELIACLHQVQHALGDKGTAPNGDYGVRTPTPEATPDQRLDALVASLQQAVPAPLQGFVPLIPWLCPPHGIRVSTTLQRWSDADDRLGISFEIGALDGANVPEPHTIWEPRPQGAPPANDAGSTKTAERYMALLAPAARWLAYTLMQKDLPGHRPGLYGTGLSKALLDPPFLRRWRYRLSTRYREREQRYRELEQAYEPRLYNLFGALKAWAALQDWYAQPPGRVHRFFFSEARDDFCKAFGHKLRKRGVCQGGREGAAVVPFRDGYSTHPV
jgi:hypothetical protein